MGTIVVALLLLINTDRANIGVNSLAYCNDLQTFATSRAESQASWNTLNHYVNGELAIDSLVSGQHLIIGENLAGWQGIVTPDAIEAALMASPEHRANILEPRFDCVALGYSQDKNVISEVFAS